MFCPRIIPALFFLYLNVPDKDRSVDPAGSINKLLINQPLLSASTTVSRDFRFHGFSLKYPTCALINHQLFFAFVFHFAEIFMIFEKLPVVYTAGSRTLPLQQSNGYAAQSNGQSNSAGKSQAEQKIGSFLTSLKEYLGNVLRPKRLMGLFQLIF